MTAYKLDKGRHSVFTLHYHLILVVKYRRKALYNEAIRERLKQIIYELTENWEKQEKRKIHRINNKNCLKIGLLHGNRMGNRGYQ
jgi:Transposase and inactivated derivatives